MLSQPSLWTWVLGTGAALAYAACALAAGRAADGAARSALALAWALHGLMLASGLSGLGGDGARFGFAPALSGTAWLALTVYGIEQRLLPQLHARWVLAALGAAAALLAAVFPGKLLPGAASAWLPLHWALGIAAYGLFAVAVVHAWLMTRAERAMRHGGQDGAGLPLLTLERLTLRFVQAGFVLLTGSLLAGGLFGGTLHGSGWRWEHKTVFAALSWLTFVVLLAGRARLGWRGRTFVRVLYVGAALLLLSYAGSRFVVEVILQRSA